MDSKKYIGMDVHKESISIAVMNGAGKIVLECVVETKKSCDTRAASRGRDPGEASEGENPAEGQDDRAQEQPDVGAAVPRRTRRRQVAGDRSEGPLPHGVVRSNCDANGTSKVSG